MAALHAQNFGCAAYISVVLVQLFQNEVSLVGCACLLQRGELAGAAAAAVSIDQRWQVLAVELASP